jgi:DNA-directed RNA polymerase sigma subunit (sigma70/sigma32)
MEQARANPPNRLIETINKLIRTSQQIVIEIGCAPTDEEARRKTGDAPQNSTQVVEYREGGDQVTLSSTE